MFRSYTVRKSHSYIIEIQYKGLKFGSYTIFKVKIIRKKIFLKFNQKPVLQSRAIFCKLYLLQN